MANRHEFFLDRVFADSTVTRIQAQYRPAPQALGQARSAGAPGEQRSDLAHTTPGAGNREPEAVVSPPACLAAALLEDYGNTVAAQRSLSRERRIHEQTLDRLESKLATLQHRRRASEARNRKRASEFLRA